jgi:FkbM family methyltransferase
MLITDEMHEVVRADVEYFAEHGFKIKGIVHIGANTGQEIPWYLWKLYMPLLVFEPIPESFSELHRVYGKHAICAPFALGSKNETITLRIPEDGDAEKASKYTPIETVGHDWTKVPMTKEINVQCLRFDTWADNHNHVIDISAYDTVVIDVQGMELEALKGFGKYLQGFHFLVVECSASPVYDGEASAQEVINYLTSRGFIQLTPIEEHDDIIFKRRGLWD